MNSINNEIKSEVDFIIDCLNTIQDTMVRYPLLSERRKNGAITDEEYFNFKSSWIEDVKCKIKQVSNSILIIEKLSKEER